MGNGTSALKIGGFSGSTPAPGTGLPVLTGFPFTGNLDLTGNSASVASMVVSSDTSAPNVITVGTGNTFTVTGNVLVGGLQASTIKNTVLQVTGGGNLKFGSGAGGTFEVWNRSANGGVSTTTSVFDASGASSFTADYGNGGSILIGSSGDNPYGTLILGAKNNTLIAGRLDIGLNLLSGSTGNRGGGTLQLAPRI